MLDDDQVRKSRCIDLGIDRRLTSTGGDVRDTSEFGTYDVYLFVKHNLIAPIRNATPLASEC